MTERPILFSAPMVRALLDGAKSQTRRMVKPQPEMRDGALYWSSPRYDNGLGAHYFHSQKIGPPLLRAWANACPYGVAGDRLWVREGWRFGRTPDGREVIEYRADGGNDPAPNAPDHRHWRSSIHLRRRLARITLEVVDVRVERLLDVTDKDAVAEGVVYANPPPDDCPEGVAAAVLYLDLFYRINKAVAAGSNPWVWVVEFNRC